MYCILIRLAITLPSVWASRLSWMAMAAALWSLGHKLQVSFMQRFYRTGPQPQIRVEWEIHEVPPAGSKE